MSEITITHSAGHQLRCPADTVADKLAGVVSAFIESIDDASGWQAEAEHWRTKYATTNKELQASLTRYRVDGDLLTDIIANHCPDYLASDVVRDIAEATLVQLARCGTTVCRGFNQQAWHPDIPTQHPGSADADTPTNGENHHHPNERITPDLTTTDERVECGVFVDDDCVIKGSTKGAAQLVAQFIPGATVHARTITTGPWTPLPTINDANNVD